MLQYSTNSWKHFYFAWALLPNIRVNFLQHACSKYTEQWHTKGYLEISANWEVVLHILWHSSLLRLLWTNATAQLGLWIKLGQHIMSDPFLGKEKIKVYTCTHKHKHTCTQIRMHICTFSKFLCTFTAKENLQQEKYSAVFHINLYCNFRWIKLNSASVDMLSSILSILHFYLKLEHCSHGKKSA